MTEDVPGRGAEGRTVPLTDRPVAGVSAEAARAPSRPQPHRVPPWLTPPKTCALGPDEVHVWRATLTVTVPRSRALEETLSPDERERAGRFRFERDRGRFVAARGVLRAILGHYLGRSPGRLEIGYDPRGKPVLAGEDGPDSLAFSVSHSNDLGLFALARGRRIGVDVEHVEGATDADKISQRFFSPRDVAALRALPCEARPRAFLACWTRKEAYAKARGDGLALPLDSFSVSLAPGEPAALLDAREGPGEIARWWLRDLLVDPMYVAAVAVEGQEPSLSCWEWTDHSA